MTIHFFTKGDILLPDSRQRAFRIAEELEVRGIHSVVHAPPVVRLSTTPWPQKFSLIMAVCRALTEIKKGDIVFLQRTISNKYFFVIMVVYLKLFRRKMIFDFDDAIYLHDPFKTKMLVRMAAAVIVCSQPLKEWAQRYNKNVHIIHTTVKLTDYATYTKDYSSSASPIVIGWIGTAKYHLHNLELLAHILGTLQEKTTTPFVFRLVGAGKERKVYDLFESLPGLHTEFIDSLSWGTPESIPKEIQKFDIGVNPLVEKSEWNLARSSFKPLEYMACGVATISSAVGEITNVIHDGENGFLADSVEEWVEKLVLLISDTELRAKLGKAGQETMRTTESYEAILPRVVEIIKKLAA